MNSTYLDWISNHGNPRLIFNLIPAYPIFMFLGIILTLIMSIIRFKLKGIPLRELEIGIVIIVPIGILGASIFGKIFIPNMTWYHVFFFWEPGMSLFGGLFLGVICGFIWFYKCSKVTQISIFVYADCIVPNILLGQVIGRWGNFFNHEILGKIVDYNSLNWLPSFIKMHLFYFPNLTGYELSDNWWQLIQAGDLEILGKIAQFGEFKGQTLKQCLENPIQYREPLFLIEGIFNLILWFLITFFVSNIGRFFSKPKPWNLEPKSYPGYFNKYYKSLPENKIISVSTQIPIRYHKVLVDGKEELRMGFFDAWNKAYFWYNPDLIEVEKIEQKIFDHHQQSYVNKEKLDKLKQDYQNKIIKLNQQFSSQIKNLDRKTSKFKELSNKHKDLINNKKHSYINKRKELKNNVNDWKCFLKGNVYSRELEKLNNPNNYLIIRCGVQTGCYIVGYTILRIILETRRSIEELMIPTNPTATFILLSLILVFGIIFLVLTQFFVPYHYREVHWLYEKSY